MICELADNEKEKGLEIFCNNKPETGNNLLLQCECCVQRIVMQPLLAIVQLLVYCTKRSAVLIYGLTETFDRATERVLKQHSASAHSLSDSCRVPTGSSSDSSIYK